MNDILLIYTGDFKRPDFGPGHAMIGDRYEKAMKEFKKMGLLDKFMIKKSESISEDII